MPRLWVGVVFALLIAPSLVLAHAFLIKSIPGRRATLFKAPAKVQLWFNERLEARFSSVSVSDSNGKKVDLGIMEVGADDPKRLSVGLKPLPAGAYIVKFRVLSVDGHVVEDRFPFSIKR